MADYNRAQIKPGRLVQNVSNTILPLNKAGDLGNVDIEQPGEATRRKGYVRALTASLGGNIRLIGRVTEYDGSDSYVIVGPDGVNRET
jgi:hypothetical protein